MSTMRKDKIMTVDEAKRVAKSARHLSDTTSHALCVLDREINRLRAAPPALPPEPPPGMVRQYFYLEWNRKLNCYNDSNAERANVTVVADVPLPAEPPV